MLVIYTPHICDHILQFIRNMIKTRNSSLIWLIIATTFFSVLSKPTEEDREIEKILERLLNGNDADLNQRQDLEEKELDNILSKEDCESATASEESIGRRRSYDDDLNKGELDPESKLEDEAERDEVLLPDGLHHPKNIRPYGKEKDKEDNHDVHKSIQGKIIDPDARTRKRRNFVDGSVLWENGVVHYEIDKESFGIKAATATSLIDQSIEIIQSSTCVQWKPRTTEQYYVRFRNETGCWSYVGNIKRTGGQTISINTAGCLSVHTVLHEMLHAMGSEHEQSRGDRNGDVKILWENIDPKRTVNFDLKQTKDHRPYDYNSVLQYGLKSFSGNSLNTMSIPDIGLEYLFTNKKNGLSFYDEVEINDVYKCTDTCSLSCQNGGVKIKSKTGCKCLCPNGLKGSDCSQLNTSSGCGEFVHLKNGQSADISMQNYDVGLSCAWLVKGESNSRIKSTLTSIDLPYNNEYDCYHWVEIRDYLQGDPGKDICGTKAGAIYTKKLIGHPNMMMIRFDSITHRTQAPGKGFSLRVEAYHSGCVSFPCQHGSTCVDSGTSGDFSCLCYQGFSGPTCNEIKDNTDLTCDLDNDIDVCVFSQETQYSNFFWSLSSEPLGDKTLGKYQYLSMIPTSNYYLGWISLLVTTAKFAVADRCLSFDFVMVNNKPDSQWKSAVRIYYQGSNMPLNEALGIDHHTDSKWGKKKVHIPAVEELVIIIEGVFGYQKVGIDNIELKPGVCGEACSTMNPCVNGGTCVVMGQGYTCQCTHEFNGKFCQNRKGYACFFEEETEDECFLKESTNDKFDWTRRQGKTPSGHYKTGPNGAHEGKYYKYIETSSPRILGDNAVLISDKVFEEKTYCLTMYYNMTGATIGSLYIKEQIDNSDPIKKWEKTGNQVSNDLWSYVEVEFLLNAKKKIIIEGERGKGYTGDIAIDEIKLTPGPCQQVQST